MMTFPVRTLHKGPLSLVPVLKKRVMAYDALPDIRPNPEILVRSVLTGVE